MRTLLALPLLVLTVYLQGPVTTPQESELVVVKFNWGKHRQNNDLIHGVDDPPPSMNGPISIAQQPARTEPQEVKNKRDLNERRIEMAVTEKNASLSAVKNSDFYMMHLEVKNSSEKIIKSFVWEFQPAATPEDYEPRQYVCTMKARPRETKTFDILTPFSPVKVISVSDKRNEKDGKVLINQIEYTDGSRWKRNGWSIIVPPELTQTMSIGKCVVF